MKRIILKNLQAPGDVVMLTGAVRDMHGCHPGQFMTDVRTSAPELWQNNPYLTRLDEHDPAVELIECQYPLILRSNQLPYHFIHGFMEFLNERLGLNIRPTAFKGDIHLSEMEKAESRKQKFGLGGEVPVWAVAAGGKRDFTIKWWETKRYQQVVDHFRGRIQFVQVGGRGHFHPKLDGVIDLRGRTTLRELIQLVYHCDGVLTPVSLLTHLAAAVPPKKAEIGKVDSRNLNAGVAPTSTHPLRPCVVIAGGREPPHWEAYPTHQFLHTVGMLPCCQHGGCWRSRTRPLGDGTVHDRAENLCLDVVNNLPRCMDLITAEEVIQRIEMYLAGAKGKGAPQKSTGPADLTSLAERNPMLLPGHLTAANAARAAEEFVRTIPHYPAAPGAGTGASGENRDSTSISSVNSCEASQGPPFSGRGIVICGGGEKYFPGVWVTIHIFRHLGCKLPIQIWYLGEREMDARMRLLLEGIGATCVDALNVRQRHPIRTLGGWESKAYAILHCPFKEVLYPTPSLVFCVTARTSRTARESASGFRTAFFRYHL
jgi:hypothetical protein